METMQPINTFKSLDDVFNIESTPVSTDMAVVDQKPATAIVPASDSVNFPTTDELMLDYQKARKSLHNLIDQGEHVVSNMLQIAAQTESARGFEVAGNLIKTMSDVAKDLISLHKATNDAKKKTEDNEPKVVNNTKNTQNNVVFTGSTTDLMDFIKTS